MKKSVRNLMIASSLSLALSGCSVLETLDEKADKWSKNAIVDLAAAARSAVAHGDPGAQTCWAVLAGYIEFRRQQGTTEVIGVFTAFQKARNIRRLVDAGIPEQVHIACAHMFGSAKRTILRLGRLAL